MIYKKGKYYTREGEDVTNKMVSLIQSHALLAEVVSEVKKDFKEDDLPWVDPFAVLPLPEY